MIYLNKIPRYGLDLKEIINLIVKKHIDISRDVDSGKIVYTSKLINGKMVKITEIPAHGKRCGEKNFTIEAINEKQIRALLRTVINLMLKS